MHSRAWWEHFIENPLTGEEAQGKANVSLIFLHQTLILSALEKDTPLGEDSETCTAPTQSVLVKA